MTRNHGIISSTAKRSADSDDPRVQHTVVPGGHGHAFEVKAGTSFRIIDIHGHQIVDMMAWVLPYPASREHLSMAYSRYVLGGNVPPPSAKPSSPTSKSPSSSSPPTNATRTT